MSSLQELVDPWWQECHEHPVTRGQLVHALIPHVGLTPYVLDAEGRSEPTNHDRALFTIRPLRVKDRHRRPQLPVAALPQYPGEVWATYRSKIRPCLVLSVGGDDVPPALRPQSSPRWQSAPTLLVAPYYGAARTDQRSGWHAPFLERIRACEYPQFLMDSLPLSPVGESVLRLDHLQAHVGGVVSAATSVTTAWLLPPTSITGQDHLAVRAISEAIYAELVPCVTNVTDRIRLFAFYPWFTWTFGRKKPNADYDEFVRLFRRAECALTMIGARHEMSVADGRPDIHGEGLPGRRRLLGQVRELNGSTARLSTFADPNAPEPQRYFRAELGGLDQYYRGTLQTLDVMGGSRQAGMKVTPGRGVRLAQVFDAGVNGELFHAAPIVTSVEQWGRATDLAGAHLQEAERRGQSAYLAASF